MPEPEPGHPQPIDPGNVTAPMSRARNILDRDFAKAQTEPVRSIGNPALIASVDYATAAFERCSASAPDGDVNLGILIPLHQMIEMADGIQELLEESCVVAAAPLLRSMLEGSASLRWVLEEDTQRRALAYVVSDLRERVRWYRRMDPDTVEGAAFRNDLRLAESDDFPFPEISTIRTRRESLEQALQDEPFLEVTAEYERIEAGGGRVRNWYQLFDGPSHMRDLTRRTGQLRDYEILYRTWSSTGHVQDLDRVISGDDQGPTISVIRAPSRMPMAYLFAILFLLESVRRVLEFYRPGELEQYSAWYLAEIGPALSRLEAIEEAYA